MVDVSGFLSSKALICVTPRERRWIRYMLKAGPSKSSESPDNKDQNAKPRPHFVSFNFSNVTWKMIRQILSFLVDPSAFSKQNRWLDRLRTACWSSPDPSSKLFVARFSRFFLFAACLYTNLGAVFHVHHTNKDWPKFHQTHRSFCLH